MTTPDILIVSILILACSIVAIIDLQIRLRKHKHHAADLTHANRTLAAENANLRQSITASTVLKALTPELQEDIDFTLIADFRNQLSERDSTIHALTRAKADAELTAYHLERSNRSLKGTITKLTGKVAKPKKSRSKLPTTALPKSVN